MTLSSILTCRASGNELRWLESHQAMPQEIWYLKHKDFTITLEKFNGRWKGQIYDYDEILLHENHHMEIAILLFNLKAECANLLRKSKG